MSRALASLLVGALVSLTFPWPALAGPGRSAAKVAPKIGNVTAAFPRAVAPLQENDVAPIVPLPGSLQFPLPLEGEGQGEGGRVVRKLEPQAFFSQLPSQVGTSRTGAILNSPATSAQEEVRQNRLAARHALQAAGSMVAGPENTGARSGSPEDAARFFHSLTDTLIGMASIRAQSEALAPTQDSLAVAAGGLVYPDSLPQPAASSARELPEPGPYQPPKALNRKYRVLIGAFTLSVAGAVALLGFAMGPLPGILVATSGLLVMYAPVAASHLSRRRLDHGTIMSSLDQNSAFARENKALVDWLSARAASAMGVGIRMPIFGTHKDAPYSAFAATIKDETGKWFYIGLDESLLGTSVEWRKAILAHELGHLYLGDILHNSSVTMAVRLVFRFFLFAGPAGAIVNNMLFLFTGDVAGGVGLFPWIFEPIGLLVPAGEALIAFLLPMLALLIALAGNMAGMSAIRQRELRADHFAAWLTRPEWLAEWMEQKMAESPHAWDPYHPPLGRRIAHLRSLEEQ